jgi:hypothetical protein
MPGTALEMASDASYLGLEYEMVTRHGMACADGIFEKDSGFVNKERWDWRARAKCPAAAPRVFNLNISHSTSEKDEIVISVHCVGMEVREAHPQLAGWL